MTSLGSTLGFIGCGKMAGAILRGVMKSGKFSDTKFFLSDKNPTNARELGEASGGKVLKSNIELAKAASVLLLCVKPSDVASALKEMRPALDGKLLISIAAGVTITSLVEYAGSKTSVVRVMPNTPAFVHRGASAYATSGKVTDAQKRCVEKIFSAVGTVFSVAESALDAVTGVSGSGPAYIYMVIEAMADGGVLMGLPRDLALQLAAQTVVGAGEMVLQTDTHPAILRDMVTSPGGTTIAAVDALEASGVRAAFISAVRAATERSRAMGAAGAGK